jgi:archaemetzincin
MRLRLLTELDAAELSEAVAGKLREVYGLDVEIMHYKHPRAEDAYVAGRRQYNAAAFLELLDVENDLTLLITERDLFFPGLNFVFGYAPGAKGVVSVHRLRQGVSHTVYLDRVVKEAVHEVGHMLGLRHCSTPRCVMNFSNSVSEVDKKSDQLCQSCLKKVRIHRD